MAYLGQGAQLIVNGENVISNVFYATIPGGAGKPLYWSVTMDNLMDRLY
jgi:KUP system potassium uptake protein